METGRILIIARKEFADTLRGRRFLLVLGMFLIIAFIGALQGIQSYHTDLDSYSKMLTFGTTGVSPFWLVKPTVLDVFMHMGQTVSLLGAVLGIAVGFDLFSREKEDHSLKVLLSHPVYRDEVITGKALGGMATLALATVLAMGITLSLLLISSHVPLPGECGMIAVFGAATLLYLAGCFAIALAMSVVADRSGEALMYAFIVFFLLSLVLPAAGTVAADAVVGDGPEAPAPADDYDMEQWYAYQEEWRRQHDIRNAIVLTVHLFSPENNYDEITRAVTQPNKYLIMHGPPDDPDYYRPDSEPDYTEVFGHLWKNIVALFLVPSIFLGYAYIRFQRLDLR
ncbi:ABC transporter permease [uncultured Methanofollis sp.]|uniref:ABC transporter permease n=1 Tax=uncultured Methanofollis sp. TaxID=262500 RepID=UPI002607AA06|nr:ABC transporter permease subunit [uncultured Methanofollis sp.]